VVNTENAKELGNKYTIFGEVESGMDVVDAIAGVPTDIDGIPLEDIIVKRVVTGQ
jgi:cyclophilin family peptidyl-prolyl cis-trans isomerase